MAEVEAVKGVQFNFVSFIWKEISKIREHQTSGEYARALKDLLELISYLPKDFQETLKFQEKAQKQLTQLQNIRQNTSESDDYMTALAIHYDQNAYAETSLRDFISELCLKLDQKGYMEKRGGPMEHGGE